MQYTWTLHDIFMKFQPLQSCQLPIADLQSSLHPGLVIRSATIVEAPYGQLMFLLKMK